MRLQARHPYWARLLASWGGLTTVMMMSAAAAAPAALLVPPCPSDRGIGDSK